MFAKTNYGCLAEGTLGETPDEIIASESLGWVRGGLEVYGFDKQNAQNLG